MVGLGFMGGTHARAWLTVPGAQLSAVVSRDEKKLAGDLSDSQGNLGRATGPLDFSQVHKYRSYEDVLADPEIDAIDLCTPTDRHAVQAKQAMRSGKHVLVEKPLALTAAEAEKVAREAELCGRILMVAQVLRFMPAYVIARDRLTAFGPIRNASFRRRCAAPAWSAWLTDTARSGGGAFDLLIHDVDYARWLFGLPQRIAADGAVDEHRGIDLVNAQLDYPGFAVTVSGGWYLTSAYPFSMEFTIAAEDGVLEWSGGVLTEYRAAGEPLVIDLPKDDPFESELAHFHNCAVAGRASQICPVSESVDAVRLMEQIIRKRAESAILKP